MLSVRLTEFIHLLNEAGKRTICICQVIFVFPLFQFITTHYHIKKQWKNKINWDKKLTTTYIYIYIYISKEFMPTVIDWLGTIRSRVKLTEITVTQWRKLKWYLSVWRENCLHWESCFKKISKEHESYLTRHLIRALTKLTVIWAGWHLFPSRQQKVSTKK